VAAPRGVELDEPNSLLDLAEIAGGEGFDSGKAVIEGTGDDCQGQE
jgi:hypothetical protein